MAKNKPAEATGENTFLAASRIFTGALVVVAALAAAVISLGLILNNYDLGDETTPAAQATAASQTAAISGARGGNRKGGGQGRASRTRVSTPVATPAPTPAASPTDTASVSASSVVAVLTPVIAGIVGIAGLFFGISATGSARGREAEAEKVEAEAEKVKAERDLAEIDSTEGNPRPPLGGR